MTHIISPRSILYYIASDIFQEQKTWATGMSSLWTSLFRERARGSPCHPAIEAPRIRFGWKRSLKHISRSLLPKSIFVFAHEFIPDLPITSYPKIPHHTKRNSNVSLWRYNTKFDCPRCIVVFKCMIPQSETTAETRSREVSLKKWKSFGKEKMRFARSIWNASRMKTELQPNTLAVNLTLDLILQEHFLWNWTAVMKDQSS